MTRKQKKLLFKIIISTLFTILISFLPVVGHIRFFIYLIPYLMVGYPILKKAFRGIINRQIFDENFLMATATVGAMVLGITKTGDYTEAVAVMIFYQLGEFFQSYAIGKSRKSISSLMDIRPEYANIEKDGTTTKVSPEDVETGETLIVFPGEKIPIDGAVIYGSTSLDTSALTGESIPKDVSAGDEVISGCINLSGLIKIKTTKKFGESAVSKILELLESASAKKSRSENFISKFSRFYTPFVCVASLILAIIPPAIRLLLNLSPLWSEWIYRALTFLVISCPCALVISIPLSFFAAIGGAGREGILIKGSRYLETLSKATIAVFDKTGTLTKGSFEVTDVMSTELTKEKLIEYAALAESISSHPIAAGIIKAYGKSPDTCRISEAKEISGKGIVSKVDKKTVAAGNEKLMSDLEIPFSAVTVPGTVVYIAIDGKFCGYIVISDILKKEAADAIRLLKEQKIRKTVILTGDNKEVATAVGNKLGIDEIYPELLPQEKVEKLESLLGEKETVIYTGDGINDAPVLARADIGIAMGALGSDAAIEAADVVLMDDNPTKISKAIKISKKCMKIVYQNIIFSIGVKFLCLILGATGFSDMKLAIFADVGVMVIAVLNAMRMLSGRRNKNEAAS